MAVVFFESVHVAGRCKSVEEEFNHAIELQRPSRVRLEGVGERGRGKDRAPIQSSAHHRLVCIKGVVVVVFVVVKSFGSIAGPNGRYLALWSLSPARKRLGGPPCLFVTLCV